MHDFVAKYLAHIVTGAGILGVVIAGAAFVHQSNQAVRDDLRAMDQRLSGQIQFVDKRLTEEIRADNQQLLQSIGNHTHSEDGSPQFSLPPGSDSMAPVKPANNTMEVRESDRLFEHDPFDTKRTGL